MFNKSRLEEERREKELTAALSKLDEEIGKTICQIAVGEGNTVYGLSRNGKLYYFDDNKRDWVEA